MDGSSHQPISLERYQRALSDADKFAAWLTDYHTHVTALGGALQGEVAGTQLGHHAICQSQEGGSQCVPKCHFGTIPGLFLWSQCMEPTDCIDGLCWCLIKPPLRPRLINCVCMSGFYLP